MGGNSSLSLFPMLYSNGEKGAVYTTTGKSLFAACLKLQLYHCPVCLQLISSSSNSRKIPYVLIPHIMLILRVCIHFLYILKANPVPINTSILERRNLKF